MKDESCPACRQTARNTPDSLVSPAHSKTDFVNKNLFPPQADCTDFLHWTLPEELRRGGGSGEEIG